MQPAKLLALFMMMLTSMSGDKKARSGRRLTPLAIKPKNCLIRLGTSSKSLRKIIGKLLAQSQSFYDVSGNRVLEQASMADSGASSKGYQTERVFNQADQLESITLGKTAAQKRTCRFEYNTYGDLTARHNPGFKDPITYQYNDRGELSSLSFKEGSRDRVYAFSYDWYNNLTSLSLDSSFKIYYSFDENNLPLSETIEDEFGSYQVLRTYNGEGNIETLQFPDGSSVHYTYEGPFVKGVKRLDKAQKELYTHQIASRDQMGHILEEVLPGKLGIRKHLWDNAGRRIEIVTDFLQDKVLKDGYDSLDNITKRKTVLDDEHYTTNYEYDALSQLICEKGDIEHSYSYDSMGNRRTRDSSVYHIDEMNQLIEAEGAINTFDQNGNLATKTVAGKTWIYQSNPLNQIISITDPDQNRVKFTYDVSGRRLTKQIEAQGKKTKIYRFFYLNETEVGCLDENGFITELKIPSNPNYPEAPCIALEIKKEAYVPLHDLQGNIVCLLDPNKRIIVESYRYTVYGQEKITNEKGRIVSDSSIGNPWRYCGKRVDKEIGLIYFGYRYYDPEVGRWISPDPLGGIDGPNLYTYARNNPMTYVDYFGLASEVRETQNCICSYCLAGEGFCHCLTGDYSNPDRHNGCLCLGTPCHHKNGRGYIPEGSTIRSSLSGIGHGVVDFILNNPRFHGSLQALGGLAEASFGGGMTLATYGAAAPFGWPVMAHGLDQFITGVSTAFTGRPRDTLTSHLLQKTGMSHQTANFVDSGLSMGGSLGGAYFIQRPRVAAIAALSVPESTMVSLEGGQNFKPFTRSYYKENLVELTGISPSGQQVHAHHVFAQQFKEEFLKKGINIHDPKYLTWWEASSHRAAAKQYNLDWIEFMTQNPGATEAQILEKGRKMMAQHGIEVNY